MSDEVIVSVTEGKIRGIKQESSFSGTKFYSFYGVPYAQPPIAELRFQDPVELQPWDDIYDATKEKEGCAQFSFKWYRYTGSEDCLYINIHTTQLPSEGKSLKPVIFFIHPGSFMNGSPDSSHQGSPNFIMHNDIVYVGISYRLHILGYLNLELEECSGNQGVKDIIIALRWIQKNIHNFNGDPNNVTVFGSSSGAAMTHILLISPITDGLFHKAIIAGSYLFNPLIVVPRENKSTAFKFARALGYHGDDSRELLKFLKQIPTQKLLETLKKFRTPEKVIYLLFSQCHTNVAKLIKPAFQDQVPIFPLVAFLPTPSKYHNGIAIERSREVFENITKVPLIFGICDNEAVLGFTGNLKEITDKNYKKGYRQSYLSWMCNCSDDDIRIINQEIDAFYLKNSLEDVPSATKIEIMTDAAFSDVYDTLINIISVKLPSSVYVYKFQYQGDINTTSSSIPWKFDGPVKGTFHLDDLSYWADMDEPKSNETVDFINMFTKLICTFAKTGNPNYEGLQVQWKPTTVQKPCHLIIDKELKMIDGKLNTERLEFWDNLKTRFMKN